MATLIVLIVVALVVLERVDGNGGQVKIGGDGWGAPAPDEGGRFEHGAAGDRMENQGAAAPLRE